MEPSRLTGNTIGKDVRTKEMRRALVHRVGEGTSIEGSIVLPSTAAGGSGYGRREIAVGLCFHGGRVRECRAIAGHVSRYLSICNNEVSN